MKFIFIISHTFLKSGGTQRKKKKERKENENEKKKKGKKRKVFEKTGKMFLGIKI